MDQPRRFHVGERDGVTTIEWRWIGAHHAIGPVFLAMVCGLWWYWYRGMAEDGLSLWECCFLAAAAVPGVLAIHLVLGKLLNRSLLVIDADSLALRQGPIPWRGSGRWPRAGLDGFFYRTVRYRGVTSFMVYAVWGDKAVRRIADDLRDEDEARWLATTLDHRFARGRLGAVLAPR